MLKQNGPGFSKSRGRCSSVHKARLPGALREAGRWWSRHGCAFSLLSIAPAFPGADWSLPSLLKGRPSSQESEPVVVHCNATSLRARCHQDSVHVVGVQQLSCNALGCSPESSDPKERRCGSSAVGTAEIGVKQSTDELVKSSSCIRVMGGGAHRPVLSF